MQRQKGCVSCPIDDEVKGYAGLLISMVLGSYKDCDPASARAKGMEDTEMARGDVPLSLSDAGIRKENLDFAAARVASSR